MCRLGAVLGGVLVVALASGCPIPGDEGDGGTPDRDAEAEDAQLIVGHRVEVEESVFEGTGPVELGDGWTLEVARLGVSELRAHNDRGGPDEPAMLGVGTLDLLGAPRDVRFEAAPPATYAQISLGLAAGTWGPALRVDAVRESVRYEIVGVGAQTIELRCDSGGMALEPGDSLRVVAAVDVREVLGVLEGHVLPAPVDGVVHIEAATAPAVIADVEARVAEVVSLRCDEEEPAGASVER